MRTIKMLARDLLLLAITLGLYRASHQLDAASLFYIPLAFAAGAMIAFVGYLGHEWGHLLGAWSGRSQVQVANRVTEIFLFKYDIAHNRREQFLRMSAGGFIASGIAVLFLSLLWKDCTTRGAVIGGFLGLISSVVLTVLSPSVWEATLGNPAGSAFFPYTSPALFSMSIAFFGIWFFSITDRSAQAAKERGAFKAQQVRAETGLGASRSSGH